MPQRPRLPLPRPLCPALALAATLAGCVVPTGEPPAPPSPARAEPVDRQAAAALDGRDTFALAGHGSSRWVSVAQSPRSTFAVSDDGTLADVSRGPARPVVQDVLPEVRFSEDGRLVAYSVRRADDVADVHVLVDGATRQLTGGLPAVVLAVSPRGDHVAVLAAAEGLPALWTVATDGGSPRQLTNVDLPRPKGRAPEGFVPPPVRASDVWWVGDAIAFDAADGTWRIDARTGEVLERP